MDALILGGDSERHYDWVRQVQKDLAPHVGKAVFLDYRHWSTHDGIDINYEIEQAGELAKGLQEYVVVAKSIGSVLTILATAKGILTPRRCVFAGFPLRAVEQSFPQVAVAMPNLPPTAFVHNETDPLGTAKEVVTLVAAHAPEYFVFQTVPGNSSHDYLNFDMLTRFAVADG